jgi:hypothetical protein
LPNCFLLQVMLFGGLRYNRTANNVRRSTDLYVLDFSERTPRWRRAAVDNINTQGAYQLDFPNTGIVPLPESGAVALMHRSVRLWRVTAAQLEEHTHCWPNKTISLTTGGEQQALCVALCVDFLVVCAKHCVWNLACRVHVMSDIC